MEPVKTSENIWSGIIACLILSLITSVVIAVAVLMLVEWIEFIMYGETNDFFKLIIFLFPIISIYFVIVYLLDREGFIW